jgi:hypothetical protein
MSLLTMTPCYSIMLSFLALVLIVIIAAPLFIIVLRKLWELVRAFYMRITKKGSP